MSIRPLTPNLEFAGGLVQFSGGGNASFTIPYPLSPPQASVGLLTNVPSFIENDINLSTANMGAAVTDWDVSGWWMNFFAAVGDLSRPTINFNCDGAVPSPRVDAMFDLMATQAGSFNGGTIDFTGGTMGIPAGPKIVLPFTAPDCVAYGTSGAWFVGDYTAGKVYRFDGLTIIPTWTASVAFPQAILVNGAGNVVVSSTSDTIGPQSTLYILDGATGATLKHSGALGRDATCMTTDGTDYILGVYYDNVIIRVDGTTLAITASHATGTNPHGICRNPVTGNFFVANDGDGTVTEHNHTTLAIANTFTVGANPIGIAALSTGQVAVANSGDGTVSAIVAGIVTTVVTGLTSPFGMAVDSGNFIVTDSTTATNFTPLGVTNWTGNVGTGARGLAVNGDDGIVYVCNFGSNYVSLLKLSDGTAYAYPSITTLRNAGATVNVNS